MKFTFINHKISIEFSMLHPIQYYLNVYCLVIITLPWISIQYFLSSVMHSESWNIALFHRNILPSSFSSLSLNSVHYRRIKFHFYIVKIITSKLSEIEKWKSIKLLLLLWLCCITLECVLWMCRFIIRIFHIIPDYTLYLLLFI